MASIKLTSGATFELATNGWSKSETDLNLIVIANDASLEAVEEAFNGNDVIELTDADHKSAAKGYTTVTSIGITHNYPIGGVDEEGEDITADVWNITLARPSVYDMIVEAQNTISAHTDAIAENAETTATISAQLEATQEAVDMLLME